MSREIKFRGKSKRTGQWIYGDLLTSPNGLLKYIVQKSKFNRAFLKNLAPEEVEYGSDGEYTGRKDCKGKEIYEGEIVFDGFVNKIIVWREGSWQLQRDYSFTEDDKEHKGTHYSTLWMWTGETNNAIRVIGNLFENPELLEDKNV